MTRRTTRQRGEAACLFQVPDGGEIGATNLKDQPELIMMTAKTHLPTKIAYGLSIAFLAVAFTSGVSVVRAESDEPAPSWREMIVDPIMDAVRAVEDRITNLETKAALLGWSFRSRQITTHVLCIADDEGGQICINRAQLDGLLKMMQTAVLAQPQPARATDCIIERKSTAEPVEVAPAAPATETSSVDTPAETKTTIAAAGAHAPAARVAPAEDTPDRDRSVPPSAAAPGHEPLAHPEEEIILWAD